MAKRWILMMVLLALIATACAQNSVEAGGGAGSRPDECRNVASIAALLSSGFPVFDYEPARDIESLIEQSDVVITGTLESVVRIESDAARVSFGSEFLTEYQIGEFVAYGDVPEEINTSLEQGRTFHFGTDWQGGDDPLETPVLFDETQTRFVVFLQSSDIESSPWTFGPQGFHVWCSLDDEVQPVIDSVPLNTTWSPDDFELAILDILDPPPVFDFVDVPSRLLADDVAAGEPGSVRHIEDPRDFNPAVGDVAVDDSEEVFFEFVVAESGTCSLGAFETLRFDQIRRVLVPQFVEVEHDGSCTLDANPHLLLVAVARRDLPTGNFSIATYAEAPTAQRVDFAAGELTEVGADDIDIPVLGERAVLEVGETGLLRSYTTHCDTRFLWWEVNGQFWGRVDEGNFAVPSDWRAVERGQEVDLIITLDAIDSISAVARGAETVIHFEPVEGESCA